MHPSGGEQGITGEESAPRRRGMDLTEPVAIGDKTPEDPSARLAHLERWAKEREWQLERSAMEQQLQLYADGQLYADEIARVAARARQRTGQIDSFAGVAVIPVVITKPSNLPVDRAAVFTDLMAGIREHKWADLIVSECDEPGYIAPNAIDLARKHRRGARWLLYMEDDVILGPDFGLIPEILREADELFPDCGIVSFFSRSVQEPGWSIHSMEHFRWLQCAAIRNTDHLVGFRTFIGCVVMQSAEKQGLTQRYVVPDQAVQTFMATEYDAFAVWCPSLVQHAEVRSVFWNYEIPCISPSYERAYVRSPTELADTQP
jgi:hypothetical protein